MFLFYYIWGFFFFIVSQTHDYVEKKFLIKNNPFLKHKRIFKYISYFEKIFLVLFHRKGWFENSLANIYRKNDIIDYRRKNFPLIYKFHLYYDRMDYRVSDLKLLVRQYDFYVNSKFFRSNLLTVFRLCFEIKKKNFLKFLIIQEIFFRKYYNSISSEFYFSYNNYNTVKLNLLFNIFLKIAKGKYIVYDLSKWEDWYAYNFNKKIKKNYKLISRLTKNQKKNLLNFRKKKLERLKWIRGMYTLAMFKYQKFIFNKRMLLMFFKINFSKIFKINFKKKYYDLLKNYYTIRFSESSVTKHILPNKIKNYSITYLRKNRIFNKGRYSRNRQLYRTGVYWCLWLNIIMVYGLYFIFYRFSFNFGYIWWGVLILAYSTIFSRIVKYNFYNVFYLMKEFYNLNKWYGYLILNFKSNFRLFLKKQFLKINLYNYISNYKSTNYSFIFNNFYYYVSIVLNYFLTLDRNIKIKFFWQGMKEKDTSFLRYKTILHWLTQIYKLLTTW